MPEDPEPSIADLVSEQLDEVFGKEPVDLIEEAPASAPPPLTEVPDGQKYQNYA